MNLAIASSRSDLNLLNTPQWLLRSLRASLVGLAVLVASSQADEGRVLSVPGSKLALTVAADLPEPVADATEAWELAEVARTRGSPSKLRRGWPRTGRSRPLAGNCSL